MKHKTETKVLSWLLTLLLVLVLGLLPGMSMTAYAATPTISKGQYIRMGAYNGEYVDWFCAAINGTGTLMLSKYVLKNMAFGSNSTYKASNVHKWLDIDSGGHLC